MATEDPLIVWPKERGNTAALISRQTRCRDAQSLVVCVLARGGESSSRSLWRVYLSSASSLDFSLFISINFISSLYSIGFDIMPPQGAAYNVDWIFSNTSNVHVATDRAWFATYIPFRTKVAIMPGAEPSLDVYGVGTVVLPTRTHRQGKTHKPSGELTLHHVLHAPGDTVNILAACVEPDISISINSGGDVVSPITEPGSNKVIGLLVHSRLIKLWLKGQSQNQSSLDPNGLQYVHASWPQSEIDKFNGHLAASQKQASEAEDAPPLTKEEKQYLKEHYGGEYRFLRLYQLSSTRKRTVKKVDAFSERSCQNLKTRLMIRIPSRATSSLLSWKRILPPMSPTISSIPTNSTFSGLIMAILEISCAGAASSHRMTMIVMKH
jgi:hypothetical protein